MVGTRVAQDPQTRLFTGDCREVMDVLYKSQRYDLIFSDPVYNMGRKYDVCNDNLPAEEYKTFTRQWLWKCSRLLSDRGSLWVLVPDEIVSWVDTLATEAYDLVRMNWCIWHYRFGQCQDSRFIRSKAHLLYFVKDPVNRIWHPERILEASDRASIYNDPRTKGTATPGQRLPLDVWYGEHLGRVQGNNKERRPLHDNQVPEKLIERIILACTDEDSSILDPFAGSGGTATVARALGRPCDTIELSEAYSESAWERITKVGPVRVSKAAS